MSSEFTEYPLENEQVEVYASTNRYARFALARLDETYVPICDWDGVARPISQAGIAQWYDTLLPIELKQIDYRPAEKLMEHWLEIFFRHRSERGLMSTEADWSDRRLYTPPADLSDEEREEYPQGKWARTAGDVDPDTVTGSFFGVVESRDASTLKMLNLMHEFLTWFPGDHQLALDNRSLLEHCVEWALAFTERNRGSNIYGHYAGGWGLYNFVHAGRLRGASPDPAEWSSQDLRAEFEAWLDGRFLFSAGLEYQGDLEAGELSETFRRQFESHGIPLSYDLTIETQAEGCKWQIKESDSGRTYIVSTHAEALSICEQEWPVGEPPPKEFYDWLRGTFETYFRCALEGIPDSWWVMVGHYGAVAQAFVHLSKVLEDPRYDQLVAEIDDTFAEKGSRQFPDWEIRQFAKRFAADISNGLWNARLNQNTYLMPSTVTPMGPLPGDPGPPPLPDEPVPELKYQSDTDCLYWVHPLLGAYQLVGEVRPDLRPNERIARRFRDLVIPMLDFDRFRRLRRLLERWFLHNQIQGRRQRLADLLDDDFPDKYLGMALALTLDWIRYGWVPEWRQFVRKIYHDGTQSTNVVYGDGKYNTLRMLIGAYKVTHDEFYLQIFDDAWGKYEELAQDPRLGGFFPEAIMAGELHLEDNCVAFDEERLEGDSRPNCYDANQEGFLGFIVDAYLATAGAERPRSRYLDMAEEFAELILAAHERGRISCSGHAFLRLALARGTLRRIQFIIGEDVETLVFAHNGEEFTVARSNGGTFRRAVVYMDDGEYSIVKHFAVGTESDPIALVVADDMEINL